jgi:hypothetical protein
VNALAEWTATNTPRILAARAEYDSRTAALAVS